MDSRAYSDLLDIWYGEECLQGKSLDNIMRRADRLQMTEVETALKDAIMGQLNVESCVDLLMVRVRLGLARVEAAARGLTLE